MKHFSQKLRTVLKMAAMSLKGGSEIDCTAVPLKQAVLFLALPMMLELIFESVFALVDIFFVGKLGADAVATVGITESLLTIVYAISLGIGVAASAIVSRRIGEKRTKEASKAALQTLYLAFAVGVLIAVLGVFSYRVIFRAMGAGPGILERHMGYPLVTLASNFVIVFLFSINSLFRAAGEAAVAMKVLWMANLINIVLDPILIFGLGPIPAMGVTGAALATVIGRGTAVLYQFHILYRPGRSLSIRQLVLRINFRVIGQILKLSIGTIGQNLIATSSWIVMVRIIAIFGSQVLAGYTIAIRLLLFFLLPSWGLSNAASTLVGQNLGAGQPHRAEQSVWMIGVGNIVLMCFVSILFWLIPGLLVSLFSGEGAVVEVGIQTLRIIAFGLPFYGLGMVLVRALNGAGDTLTPTLLFLFVFWLVELPLAYYLAVHLGWQSRGAFWAIVSADLTLTFLSIWLFRRGHWKHRHV